MLKIAICDYEQSLIVELKKNLKRYAEKTEKTFKDGEAERSENCGGNPQDGQYGRAVF